MILLLTVFAAIGGVVAANVSDIKRYLSIRRM
jgi:hypothetical protein